MRICVWKLLLCSYLNMDIVLNKHLAVMPKFILSKVVMEMTTAPFSIVQFSKKKKIDESVLVSLPLSR